MIIDARKNGNSRELFIKLKDVLAEQIGKEVSFMNQYGNEKEATIVLGGGLAGLSAGYILSRAGKKVLVFEGDSTVGGLAKTVARGEFRFDLGGHRFITKNEKIEHFVKELLDGELIAVPRKSKIYLRNRYFNYPLKSVNAIFGLGVLTTLKIILDYCIERLKKPVKETDNTSLEDWVINRFGRTMFNLYFKDYSEKVWGIECSRISAEWVAQRIHGLSLGVAIKNAFFKFSGKGIHTLAERFLYPQLGIGRISDKLQQGIGKNNHVLTSTSIVQLSHTDFRVEGVTVKNCDHTYVVNGGEFVSSIPITSLVQMLYPQAPEDVLDAAFRLRYRDLVVVTVMVNRERVTDQTWIYVPERKIPFGRIHEPKNWSAKMAPEGKTHLVVEYFCFEGDETWKMSNDELVRSTSQNLENLGFIKRSEVIDSIVLRVPKAYPMLEIGYRDHYDKIINYLSRFKNLHIAGRAGMFRYYNMDYAMETGMEAAENIIKSKIKDQNAK